MPDGILGTWTLPGTGTVHIYSGANGSLIRHLEGESISDLFGSSVAGLAPLVLTGPLPDLSITKTASPDPVVVGQDVTYTITITNGGSGDATAVVLMDTLSGQLGFVTADSTQGTVFGLGNTVTGDLGDIGEGRSLTVTVVARALDLGTACNDASVHTSAEELTLENNTARVCVTIVAGGDGPDLTITKTASPDPVATGQMLAYTIVVTNNGSGDATGVTVYDGLPEHVTLGMVPEDCDQASGVVTCNLGALPAGETVTLGFSVTVGSLACGTLTNEASARSLEGDENPSDNSTTVDTQVSDCEDLVDLSIIKSDFPDPVAPGQQLTYTITVGTTGDATGVVMTDQIPEGTVFVPGSGDCVENPPGSGTVIWTIGDLPDGTSVTCDVTVTVVDVSDFAHYTLNADFDQGVMINVGHGGVFPVPDDQLQLNPTYPYQFIWIAASLRGTIIKIDTDTGEILGEYLSAPDGMGRDPSRTTVDLNGNVWAGNREEGVLGGSMGSVVQVGLEQNLQCEDRNGNGVIDTSTGLGDVRDWDNAGGADTNGGVSTAQDECIFKYVRTNGTKVRHVSVAGNNVWAGGFDGQDDFDLIDGDTGTVLSTFDVDCGGYGGLVDANGVLWSADREPLPRGILRYDTKNTIPTADDTYECMVYSQAYGVGIDSLGNIWLSQHTGSVLKFDPLGNLILGPKPTFGAATRGVAVTHTDDNVWVANSNTNDVTRLNSSGDLVKLIDPTINPDGAPAQYPTGVAVDAEGKVWVTFRYSHNAMRIDPAAGSDGLGEVDLVVDLNTLSDGTEHLMGPAEPYNYSDMTGAFLAGDPDHGTWTVVYDTHLQGAEWVDGAVSWTADDGDVMVFVATSENPDQSGWGPLQQTGNGALLAGVADGRYIKVVVHMWRSSQGDSPILYDLTIDRPASAETICNDAEVSGDQPDPNLGNNRWVECTRVGSLQADLAVTKVCEPAVIEAGNPVTCVIGIINNGPATAHNVTLTDILPDGSSFVPPAALDPPSQGTCIYLPAVHQVECDLGTMEVATPVEVTIVFIP